MASAGVEGSNSALYLGGCGARLVPTSPLPLGSLRERLIAR